MDESHARDGGEGACDQGGGGAGACDQEWAVGPYFDGELPPGERAGVEAHLESCHECRSLVEHFSSLDRFARSTAVAPRVSAEQWGELWEAVRAQSAPISIQRARRARNWMIPALSAAALVFLGLWIGISLSISSTATTNPEEEITIRSSVGNQAEPEIEDGVIRYNDGRDG